MRLKKKLLGIMVCFALVLSLMPWMGLTTYAETEKPTVTILPEGAGSVEIEESTDGKYDYILTPKPNEGYVFWYWYDGMNADPNLDGNRMGVASGKKITCYFGKLCTVTYKVVGGTWSDGTTADKTETVQQGFQLTGVPTGMVAATGYTGGSWNSDVLSKEYPSVQQDTTFTYTFVADSSSSGDSSDSGSGSSSSSGSSDSGNTSGGTSSGSSDTSTTDTSAKVPYDDVAISTGSVNDITGTAAATAESNPFETKIENNDNLTTLLSLTDAEVAQGVNVWLDIQDMSATVPQAEKDIVQNASTNLTVGMYLDINLFKKVGDNTATKITETNGTVKASILIPESLWKAGRTFEIIRVHDSVASAIEGTYDENTHIFTFETDKFSTYALAYKDSTLSSDSGTNSNSGSSDSSNNTQSSTPKTGDPSDIRVWYLLLLASLGGLGFLGLSKKKKVND